MLRILGGLFCGVIGLVGLVFVGGGIRLLLRAARSARWPTVPGKVVESGTAARVGPSVGDGELPAGPQTVTRPVIRYEYTVKNVVFSSNDIGFGATESSDSKLAKTFAARYPAGAEVTVHYDPSDSSEACLEPGVRGATWLTLAVGLGLMGLAAAMWAVLLVFLR
ncbi:MAG: DUF3592 domain-containing protein [Myxococcaceae bacterium]